jgi:RHS repeat-associated protein
VDGNGVYTQSICVGNAGAQTEWVKTYVDFAGRPSMTVYADGATASNSYNGLGQMASQTDPDGIATLFAYNGKAQRITTAIDMDRNGVIDFGGTDRIVQTATSVLSSAGKTVQRTVTSVSVTNGNATMVTASIVDSTPNGLENWQTYYGAMTHSVTTLQPANQASTTTITRPDGSTQVTQYSVGRPISTTILDSTGTTISSTTLAYDEYGRLQSSTDGRNGATTYTYTPLDEILTTTSPVPAAGQAALTTTNDYNLSRQIDWVQLPDGSKTYSTYLPTGELTSISGSQTYTTTYTYDPQGRMLTQTAGTGTTTWTYSPTRGILTAKTYADGSATTYPSYSLAGRLLQRHWQRGITTTYRYDAGGSLVAVNYSDGTTPSIAYTNDRLGRPVGITDGSGTRTLSYTNDGQVASENYSQGPMAGMGTTRTYDALLRRTGLSTTLAGRSLNTTYGYDSASRINSIASGPVSAGYSYLPNSNLIGSTVFSRNGIAILTRTQNLDFLNRISSTSTTSATAGLIASYGFQINSLGQRRQATLADGSYWQYVYDPAGEVTAGQRYWGDNTAVAGQQYGYQYDAVGNRTTTATNGRAGSYTVNALNQYSQRTVPGAVDVMGDAASSAIVTVNGNAAIRKNGYFYSEINVNNTGSPAYPQIQIQGAAGNQSAQKTGNAYVPPMTESIGYDGDGNLTSDSRWTYTWDAENRLIGMQTTAAAVSAGVPKEQLMFAYDAQCRRVSKKVYAWNIATGAWQLSYQINFLYDGGALVAELNASNNLVRSYAWGLDNSGSLFNLGGIGGLMLETAYNADGISSYVPVCDGNGNVTTLVEVNSGYPGAQFEYGPFGESVRETGVGDSNPFQFSTMYSDRETGIVVYARRAYSPVLGRWLSRDPIGETGGVNTCAFVGNDPINGMDPLGLWRASGIWSGKWDASKGAYTYIAQACKNKSDSEDTLQKLAQDITGDQSDASAIKTISKGNSLCYDVSALLAKLETMIRGNVVAAARQGVSALSWDGTGTYNYGADVKSRDISSYFSPNFNPDAVIECNGTALLTLAKGTQDTIPNEFNSIYGTAGGVPLTDLHSVAEANASPGDWGAFLNNGNYATIHKGGGWAQENVIYLGNNLWAGYGEVNKSATQIKTRLAKQYNEEAPKPAQPIGPNNTKGWRGSVQFVDVAKVGQALLKVRDKLVPAGASN